MESNGTRNLSKPDTIARVIQEYIPFAVQICGLLGTSFLLLVLILDRKSTRMPPTLKIAMCSLLAVDALYLTLTVSFEIFLDFKEESLFDVSKFACYSVSILASTLASMQGYIQCVISIERVLAIAVPLKVKLLVTRRRMVAALVVVSLTMSVLGIMYATYGIESSGGLCGYRGNMHESVIIVYSFHTVVICIIPTIVLFICTCCIIVLLTQRRKLAVRESRPNLSNTEMRLTLMLVIMDILYIATWLPYITDLCYHFLEIKRYGFLISHRYHRFPRKLTRLSASTDWLVLICLSRRIRRSAMKMILTRSQ